MTWTATLLSAVDRDSHWKISVEFTDGTKTVERGYRFNGSTPAALAAFVRRKAQEFEASDSVDLAQYIGQSIDVTPPTPPTPPAPKPPTQAELDFRAWRNDFSQLESMLRITEAIPALLTTQAQTAIDNLRASLAADFLNSYIGKV